MTTKLGLGAMTLGVLGITASIVIDFLPGGKAGIQSVQILGIEISVVILLIGLWIILGAPSGKLDGVQRLSGLLIQITNLPVIVWVMVGFLIAYVLFVVSPIFLSSTLRMNYFYRYLPDKFPIGNDLIAVLDLMKGWFKASQSPYTVQFYPPFTYVFFAPLLLIDNYVTLFRLFTILSLVFYFSLTFFLPLKITEKKNIALLVLLFASGLVSYGFQFELERGQYNVFTFLLCLWSIYIFHYQPKYRIIAYILFSMSIQLKLYPAIFIVMFIDDWKNWKTTLVRFTGIAALNVLLLFVMGYQIFLDFLHSVSVQLITPGWTWNGNHSINAFVYNLAKDGFGILKPHVLQAVRNNVDPIENLLFLVFLLCFILSLIVYYLRNKTGMDPYLLAICTIGALIIPVSNDYTLSILTAPISILLCSIPEIKNLAYRLTSIIMILGISLAYASMLVPFKYKPYYLNNAFPTLFIILIFITILNLIQYRNIDRPSITV